MRSLDSIDVRIETVNRNLEASAGIIQLFTDNTEICLKSMALVPYSVPAIVLTFLLKEVIV